MVPLPVDQERSLVVVKRTGMHEPLFKEKADLVMSNSGVVRDTIYGQDMQITFQTLFVIFQLVVSATEEEESLEAISLEVNLL